uniref:COX6C domain-containing protein n=1 Tax=Strongyloides venezuelensis TaxID=75913 RepID=A0A0K0G0E9_STRVS
MIFRGSDGKSYWKETSELKLPKGGRVLSIIPKSAIALSGIIVLFTYVSFQADANPDSSYAYYYNKLVRNPRGTFEESFNPMKQIGKSKNEGEI